MESIPVEEPDPFRHALCVPGDVRAQRPGWAEISEAQYVNHLSFCGLCRAFESQREVA